ncbi:CMD domain-containing protein [Nitratireductor sp. GCM10026969]|uniref:CMD domain-containing protein n=1 Tax=Nitratireductor sp. GCM10026969 TaxID=3252645 RepID=UPI0036161C5F
MSEVFSDDIVARLAGADATDRVRAALESRADVMAMTQTTHDAALSPADPGGLSHALRTALAVRVARLNENAELADHYRTLLEKAGAGEAENAVSDPAYRGHEEHRLSAIIAFTDLVSMRPRDTRAADIEALQAAGIPDADIVRLAELNAFLAYQIRVIAGLKLMKATA